MSQDTYSQQYSGHITQSPVSFINTFWSTVAPFAGSSPGQIYWRCWFSMKWIGFAGTIRVLSNFHTLAAWCFNFYWALTLVILPGAAQKSPVAWNWGNKQPNIRIRKYKPISPFLDFGSPALCYGNESIILMLILFLDGFWMLREVSTWMARF